MDIKQYEIENNLTNTLKQAVDKIIEIQKLIKSLDINNFSATYKEKINNLKEFDFNNMLKSIKVELDEITFLVDVNNSLWVQFNEQYKIL